VGGEPVPLEEDSPGSANQGSAEEDADRG